MTGVLLAGVAALPTIGLTELQETADLQTRTDRKYIVDPLVAEQMIGEFAVGLQVLEIDGRRDFAYESVYFDTPTLESYRGSAHGRRRRFKVRTRTYVDSDLCVLEVKTAGGRGETVKERLPYRVGSRDRLEPEVRPFLSDRDLPVERLTATLTTSYRRTTLLGTDGARLTLDTGLVCLAPDGRSVGLADHVLVETKSPGSATRMDRMLWSWGNRPVRVSKYCTGLAALTPGLPANKWSRTLRTYFGWSSPRG